MDIDKLSAFVNVALCFLELNRFPVFVNFIVAFLMLKCLLLAMTFEKNYCFVLNTLFSCQI